MSLKKNLVRNVAISLNVKNTVLGMCMYRSMSVHGVGVRGSAGVV